MIDHLKRLADEAAQASFHRLTTHYLATGKWDKRLWAEWSVAEALVDEAGRAVARMHDAAHEAAEGDSLDVPLAAITESEYRALWGDR